MRLEANLGEEVKDALRIAEEAKCHSAAACKLHDSLIQILARHREQQEGSFGGSAGAAVMEATQGLGQGHSVRQESPLPVEERPDGYTSSSPHGQLTQSLDNSVDMDGFEWDDLLSTLGSSSFF